MKHLLLKPLFILLAIAFVAVGCTEEAAEDSTDATSTENTTANNVKVDASKNKVTSYVDRLVSPGGNYNDGETVIQTYSLTNVDDWEQVKVVMNEYRYGVANASSDAKNITLIGYLSGKVPNVNENKDAANTADRQCVIDNSKGYWRWAYGGVDADGKYKNEEKID